MGKRSFLFGKGVRKLASVALSALLCVWALPPMALALDDSDEEGSPNVAEPGDRASESGSETSASDSASGIETSPEQGLATESDAKSEEPQNAAADDSSNAAIAENAASEEAGESVEAQSDEAQGTYNGISIDGDFSDWGAVKKYDVDDDTDAWGNKKGWDTVNRVAMVWDGDYVYLYFESNGDDPGAVTGAGPNSNGQFAITTDLGNQTLVQLQRGPQVAGVNGAKVAVNNYDWGKTPHKWEVAIPASALGKYKETIDFGMYQVAPTITSVADLSGSKGGDFTGIIYDGRYDDWDYYPHSTIEYATSGTHDHVVDSRGALYADSAQQKLFGHVETAMPAHLNEDGGEFTSAVSLRVNGDDDLMLTPRFIAVAPDGTIDWNPQLSGLANGTYEFYLTSSTVDGTSANIDNLQADDVIYGKAMITIADGKDEMEWEIDIPTLAANLHSGWGQSKDAVSIDPSDIKVFEAQYGRLGQQWVKTAGTSTLPVVGIGLCLATVAGVYAYRRNKRKGTVTALQANVQAAQN